MSWSIASTVGDVWMMVARVTHSSGLVWDPAEPAADQFGTVWEDG